MKLKFVVFVLVVIITGAGLAGCGEAAPRETLTQLSTIDAILNGVYDGVTTLGDLHQYGDFGIGTFAGLDGEMLELDGHFYQVRADGVAYRPADNVETPFASVTYFDTDEQAAVPAGDNYTALQVFINGLVPTPNLFYAVKVTGTFSYMKTRSVPAQQKPYPPLTEVTKNQPVFEFHDVAGTIVRFYCPSFADGVNVPGYHLHFLTEAKDAGGHILDFTVKDAAVCIDNTPEFRLILPGLDSDFYKLDLSPDLSGELQQAEK